MKYSDKDNDTLQSNKSGTKIIGIVFCLFLLLIIVGVTYAFTTKILTGTKKYILVAEDFRLYLDETKTITDVVEETDAIPVSDEEGKETEGYYFSLVNENPFPIAYSIYLDEEDTNTMPVYALRYNLTETVTGLDITGNIDDTGEAGNRNLITQIIPANTTHEFTLKLWLGLQAENDAKGKTYSAHIRVGSNRAYYESVLNGTDPVLSSNLVPVLIADDGTVTQADLSLEWYNYGEQKWANAVVLVDDTISYDDGELIPESNIESYFVWIPRYRYQIFDEGNYTSLTSLDTAAVQAIEIEFENKDTSPVTGVAVGDWHSHPAFQAFDSNGFWVGKFESGYSGATSTETAQVNSIETDKLIVKPNVYSWRNITIGNAFKTVYEYLRDDESHMMKNTEWGAVAYLQHSVYGSRQSLRVNNNSSYLTGYAAVSEPTCGYNNGTSTSCNLIGTDSSVTVLYNTTTGYLASTTGNITGVYDMSGGAWEYVMGYTTASTAEDSSEITNIYSNFFNDTDWEKYYDKYTSTSITTFSNRILGDATGEMGTFANVADPDETSRQRSSWYGDYGWFISSTSPWFERSGGWDHGDATGVFAFGASAGAGSLRDSFRVVLTP